MANENLIAKLEQSLRQSRGARTRLAARLTELEAEADMVRAELSEMDLLAGQTEAAIFRLKQPYGVSLTVEIKIPLASITWTTWPWTKHFVPVCCVLVLVRCVLVLGG